MSPEELRARRLAGQLLTPAIRREPDRVVAALGAVQAQDPSGSLWAVGLRSNRTAEDLHAALAAGTVLRTHVLRPTWHLVAAGDLRALIAATGAAVIRAMRPMLVRNGLDDPALARAHAALRTLLADGPATRGELRTGLVADGLDVTDGTRLGLLLLHAEATGVVCSGPPGGRESTYALLEDRVPPAEPVERTVVLADLARRYFATRGPATAADFRWWAGLTAADAATAVATARDELASTRMAGRQLLWRSAPQPPEPPVALLLPNWDEYLVAYTDRSDVFDPVHRPFLDSRGDPVAQHVVVVRGRVAGTWRATARAGRLAVAVTLFARPGAVVTDAIERAAAAFGAHRSSTVDVAIRTA